MALDTFATRFWSKVCVAETGCWLWTGSKTPKGYGKFQTNRRSSANNPVPACAHRVAWELFYGPVPDGLLVLHKCDVPGCIRPDHLFVGTYQDNTNDCVQKGRRLESDRAKRRLSTENVQVIRELLARGISQRELARKFVVSPRLIQQVQHRLQRFAHV